MPSSSPMENPIKACDPEMGIREESTTDVPMEDTSWISAVVSALIAMLALLTSHASNRKVVLFQISAAAIGLTLLALHRLYTRSRDSTHPQMPPFIQRLAQCFPYLILATCCLSAGLGIVLAFPVVLRIPLAFVIVFAVIPVTLGSRLPPLCIGIVMICFPLSFLAFALLVCLVPTALLT